ncbi:MAG: hypothetical protein K6U74_14085 [Firmicutes bacterium]|nr:hypothetical protein [Bacillota bacterium]
MHGQASFPTIGGTLLNLAVLIAFNQIRADYEHLRDEACVTGDGSCMEAQACSTSAIACSRGGALETVVAADGANWEAATGIFVYEQTVDALAAAVQQFLAWEGRFRPDVLRCNAGALQPGAVQTGNRKVC